MAGARLVPGGVFLYSSGMLLLLLKVLYIAVLFLFVYLKIVFTGIVAFLKVSFFGL